jgi:choline kinase
MAGTGSRFSDTHPGELKPLISVCGKPMIERVIENIGTLYNSKFIIVTTHSIGSNAHFKKVLERSNITYEIILINKITEGPACTCLLAKDKINSDEPLIILNCDQIIADFNCKKLIDFAYLYNADGVIG